MGGKKSFSIEEGGGEAGSWLVGDGMVGRRKRRRSVPPLPPLHRCLSKDWTKNGESLVGREEAD